MVCPPWNGQDLTGRRVCVDSFVTKTAGCNSAEDRVVVENHLRPQYIEYVNLSADGIRGDLYPYDMAHEDVKIRRRGLDRTHDITGQFGNVTGFQDWIYPRCNTYSYEDARQQEESAKMRMHQGQQEGYHVQNNKLRSGMGGVEGYSNW